MAIPFKIKFILFALMPLLVMAAVLFAITLYQVNNLYTQEIETFKHSLRNTREQSLKNYVSLAQASIQPIIDNPLLDKNSAQEQVKLVLNNLKYGENDGYFFVYDQNGVCLVLPVQKYLVGTNQYNRLDNEGNFLIQPILKKANEGGGFVTYFWEKPSTGKKAEKLSYVIKLEPWGWMLGTGVYLDNIAEVARIEAQVKNNILRTFIYSLGLALLVTLPWGWVINWREKRLASDRIRELARKSVVLQTNERRHLAGELHDGINQLMIEVKYRIELAINETNQGMHYLEYLHKAKKTLEGAIKQVRDISHNLRPSLLDDLGFKAALKDLLEQFKERTNIQFDLDSRVDNLDIPVAIETTLYRLIQEGLTNVEKHAKAQHVFLKVQLKDDSLILEIKDNGCGFSLEESRQKSGIGLRNMQDRVELLSGSFTLDTSPLIGTHIRIELPKEH